MSLVICQGPWNRVAWVPGIHVGKSPVGWVWFFVDGGGVSVGQDIDLGIRGEFGEGLQPVLVALDVKDVNLEWELCEESLDGLDNVIVRGQKVVGGGLIVAGAEEILDDAGGGGAGSGRAVHESK
jgi:hypothetical protein